MRRVGLKAASRSRLRDSRSNPSPAGSTIRAGSTCCRTATCWSPRPTRRRSRTDARASEAWVMRTVMERAGAGTPSPNRITLLRDADGDGVAETKTIFLAGLQLAVRHGAGRQRPLRRRHRRGAALSLSRAATPRSPRRASRSSTCRPARSTITGPRTSSPAATAPSCIVTVGSNSNVGENGMDDEAGPRRDPRDRSRDRQYARLRVGPAQSERHGLGAAERRAVGRGQRARRDRQRPRARLHDLGEGRRLLRLAVQLLRPARRRARASRNGPIWSPRRSRRTMRSARTPPRSAWPSTTAKLLPAHYARRRLHRPARLVEPQSAAAATR